MKDDILIIFFNDIIYMLYLRCIKSNENSFSVLYCVEVLDLFCWKHLVGRVCFILLVSSKMWNIQFSHHVPTCLTLSIVLHIGKTFILCSVFRRILVQYCICDFVFFPTSLNFNKLFSVLKILYCHAQIKQDT